MKAVDGAPRRHGPHHDHCMRHNADHATVRQASIMCQPEVSKSTSLVLAKVQIWWELDRDGQIWPEWSDFAHPTFHVVSLVAHVAGLTYLLLAANKTSTGRVSSNTAALASDKTRALFAVQTPIPSLLSNVIDQSTEVLQKAQHACFGKQACTR